MNPIDDASGRLERHESAVRGLVELLHDARRRLMSFEFVDPAVALDTVSTAALPRWRQLVGDAAHAARASRTDPAQFDLCRRFARTRLLPLLLDGPIWHRSYHKPRGYPGDYGVMNYVYDQVDEGLHPYARLCHRLGLDVGACVRTRQQFIVDELASRMGSRARPLRVLSLGCGPAREIATAIARGIPRRAVELILLDQDPEALDAARRSIEPALASCPAAEFDVRYTRVSFGELLRDARLVRQWDGQDLVYCMGLLDYVADEQLRPLATALFALVAGGGTLILGNMKEPSDTFWPLDFILDWPLAYRTEHEMLDLARSLPTWSSELQLDETGNNFVLKLLRAPEARDVR